ncbi:MAG TPA: 3D domain-containing protein [Polyangiaceae bacterium]|nr:3D domain-containing protein [Polyangiaceae bacterium]
MRAGLVSFLILCTQISCSGTDWIREGIEAEKAGDAFTEFESPQEQEAKSRRLESHRIVEEDEDQPLVPERVARRVAVAASEGRALGTFRNTYYHFPTEAEFSGDVTPLFNAACETIRSVPKGFHDAVCVQGSGLLSNGATVSFAKRDCSCAMECPRTNQHICFDVLDKERFPWGRGATGKAITPLLTVAVDTDVIPLHTAIYVPEYDGVPRDVARSSVHDGCFIAQDRGLRVKGRHIDVFAGDQATGNLWNRLVPSNGGVTVIVDSPRCRR